MSNKILVEKEKDENLLLLRNLLYKFGQIHNYNLKVKSSEGNPNILIFKLEDKRK